MSVAPELVAEPSQSEFVEEFSYADVADVAAERIADLTEKAMANGDQLEAMGVVQPGLEEVETHGPHELWVIDQTEQLTGAFKYNGAANAALEAAKDPDVHRIYAASAGNWGAGLAEAGPRLGLDVIISGPEDLSPVKEAAMTDRGATVIKTFPNVVEAAQTTEQWAEADPNGIFLHPFNNENGVGGQGLVGAQAVSELHKQQEAGKIDLMSDRLVILVPQGGGSLIAGVAVAVQQERAARRMGDNVEVVAVRPELDEEDFPNRLFDGLAVKEPGSMTAPIIESERYVQDTVTVTEQSAGRAALRLAAVRGVEYEPSGLAGVAAYEQLAPANHDRPTTYLTILSGKNVAPDRYAYMEDQALVGNQTHSSTASGASMDHTRGPVTPTAQAERPRTVSTDAEDAYYDQLEESGIYLVRR
jgi:threonine dehydratase